MHQKVLIKDLSRANQAFGNKASNLAFLMKKGFRVPQGFALKWSGPLPLDASSIRQIKTLIQPLIDEHERYVVRSSAEDVFYLDYGKIKDSLLPKAASCEQFRDQVERVKEEMASLRDIEVPDMIIGEMPPPVVKRGVQRNEIQGLGVSGEYVKGRLVHVNTLHKMEKFVLAILSPFHTRISVGHRFFQKQPALSAKAAVCSPIPPSSLGNSPYRRLFRRKTSFPFLNKRRLLWTVTAGR